MREDSAPLRARCALPPLAIPTTLARFADGAADRLASARDVAQIGAAIGREFSYELLRAVSGLTEDELQAALARLVASELVFERGTPPDAVYAFKHALVQDAAHRSLLRSSRQQLHAQIAEALETHFPEITDTQPELLAQHYAEAGLVEKSVACWGKAGRVRGALGDGRSGRAISKGAGPAGAAAGRPRTPATGARILQCAGAVLQAVKGFAAPETGQAYDRARELWEQLGSPRSSFKFPLVSLAITCSAANWIWRCAWTRICCV